MNIYAHYFPDLSFTHKFNRSMSSGDEYSDHYHLTYELYYFLDGDIEYVVENRRYPLHPHDLLFIRPGEHHFFRTRSDRQYERMVINFSESLVDPKLMSLLKTKGSHYAIAGTELSTLFKRLDLHSAYYSDDALRILLKSCLDELLVKFAYSDITECPSQRLDENVGIIADYIITHLHLPLTIDDLCREFGFSRSHIFKSFMESFHEPPKQYIISKKIMLAQHLLAAGERPTDVSEMCGFSDYSTFYRAYLRIMGTPPSGQSRSSNGS